MTKQDILAFLNSIRKDVVDDPQQRWIGSYNGRLQVYLKFFKWLYNKAEESYRCYGMARNVKTSIEKRELALLGDIQQELSGNLKQQVASYSAAKKYPNYFERLSRKYSMPPSQLGIRKRSGEIIRVPRAS